MTSSAPVIFDLDGVLIDSMKIHQLAFNEVLSTYRMEVSEEFIAGRSTIEIFTNLLGGYEFSESQINDLVKLKQEISRNGFAAAGKSLLNKDAHATVSYLATSRPLMICTSGSRRNVESFFEMSGLSKFFVGVLDKDSVSRGKPDPEIYLKASSFLGVPPQECWVIEDSEAGCTAAYRAGTKLLILNNKNSPDPLLFPGSKLISRLSEIINYVE